MNSMAKKSKNLEFTFDEARELWVIKSRSSDGIIVKFVTSDDHKSGWCIQSDDNLKLWRAYTRDYFQELQDLTNYALRVLEAWTNHEGKAV